MPWKILRPATLAFLSVTALYGLGCLTLPDFSADDDGKTDDGPGDEGDVGIPPELPAESAFFIFQAVDLRSSAWPDAWAGMDLLVCNPALAPQDLVEIRQELPGVRLLAYTNVQDIQIGLFPGNPYYDALAAAFDTTWCVRRVDTGEVINVHGYDGTPGSGVPAWIVRTTSADAMAAFHKTFTMPTGYDGLYIDQSTETYPPWRQNAILDQTASFDYDGDGLADTMDDLMAEYEVSRAYFTERLRQELGADAVLVGNAGGPLADSALNGITLEGVGDRFPESQARSLFVTAQGVSQEPFVAAAWATTPESEAGCERVAEQLPGVHYGVIATRYQNP